MTLPELETGLSKKRNWGFVWSLFTRGVQSISSNQISYIICAMHLVLFSAPPPPSIIYEMEKEIISEGIVSKTGKMDHIYNVDGIKSEMVKRDHIWDKEKRSYLRCKKVIVAEMGKRDHTWDGEKGSYIWHLVKGSNQIRKRDCNWDEKKGSYQRWEKGSYLRCGKGIIYLRCGKGKN